MDPFDRYNCKNCGANISEEQLFENDLICPVCGKNKGWFSDPMFIGFDEDLEEKENSD